MRMHSQTHNKADKYCPALAYKYSGAQLWALDPRGCYTNLKRDGQRGEMMGMGGEGKIEKTFHSKSWFSFARMPSCEIVLGTFAQNDQFKQDDISTKVKLCLSPFVSDAGHKQMNNKKGKVWLLSL